jgi:rhamnulokinase
MPALRSVVAIDLGAESGRVFLCRWDGSRGELHEIHRFANAPRTEGAHLVWDLERIWDEMCRGIAAARGEAGGRVSSVGIDGWGVDYVLLDEDGRRIGPGFCYRDPRNAPAMTRAFELVPRERIYRITGIQIIPINTLYQLLAHIDEFPSDWERARTFLTLPEYFLYRLSGAAVAERTNASTTQMLDLASGSWSAELAESFGLDRRKFPPLVDSGTILGAPRPEMRAALQLEGAQIVAPACHDTGSAVAAIPFPHDDLAFISSGTWSLVGTVLDRPVASKEAERLNFTNEAGVAGMTRFLRNLIGLWLLQECVREWNRGGLPVTPAELAAECAEARTDGPSFDVESPDFLAPGDMPARLNDALARAGYDPEPRPEGLAAAIFRSLARRYAEVVASTASVTGKRLARICILGGGVRNEALNGLTARFSGLEILRGPAEAAVIGNAAVQIAALDGEHSLDEIRRISAGLRMAGD